MWMEMSRADPRNVVQFQDACDGPYCNAECPEEIVLGEIRPYWSLGCQLVVLTLVVSVSIVGVVMKSWLTLKIYINTRNREKFLELSYSDFMDDSESSVSYLF